MSESFKYKFNSVSENNTDIEDFNGPLELLLTLISKNRISISDISISDITEQYLSYLSEIGTDLNSDSEFVQMASYLLYLKSKAVISKDPELQEFEELKATLENMELQKQFTALCEVLPELRKASDMGMCIYSGGCVPDRSQEEYDIPHNINDLFSALTQILSISDSPAENNHQLIRFLPSKIRFSINDKCNYIIGVLHKSKKVSFSEVFSDCSSREEMVTVFVSLLELCSSGNISIKRSDNALTVELVSDKQIPVFSET